MEEMNAVYWQRAHQYEHKHPGVSYDDKMNVFERYNIHLQINNIANSWFAFVVPPRSR